MRRRILTLLASATASGSGSGSGARLGRASWESRAMRPNPPSIGPWSSPRRGLATDVEKVAWVKQLKYVYLLRNGKMKVSIKPPDAKARYVGTFPTKVLKERRAPRERGRMGSSLTSAAAAFAAAQRVPAARPRRRHRLVLGPRLLAVRRETANTLPASSSETRRAVPNLSLIHI